MKIEKLYYVIAWYGQEAGGAEYHAHLLCETFQDLGVEVEVLTTCSKDVGSNWYKNHYAPGLTEVGDVRVRRFPVKRAEAKRFHALNGRLINGLSLRPKEAEEFFQNSINSDALMDYIREKTGNAPVIFMPYQYGTSVIGTRVCPERSFLIPCLHDEPIAYLPPVKDMFQRVRGILFSTPPEAAFARSLYDLTEDQTRETFGVGIHEDFHADAERFREQYRINGSFILCVGRKDPGKNVYYLVELFNRYVKEEKSTLKLVVIGPGKLTDIPPESSDKIIDIGLASQQDIRDACAAADLLVQPSNRESFSMVIMESWLAGTPVLVNGHCDVTRWLTSVANGGLYFNDYYEFRHALNLLVHEPVVAERLGEQGREHITAHYGWRDIASHALEFMGRKMGSERLSDNSKIK